MGYMGMCRCKGYELELSVNETKWSILLARTHAPILSISIEYLISGLKSYRDFGETGS